jgi:osmotically-inducible protein OsmY
MKRQLDSIKKEVNATEDLLLRQDVLAELEFEPSVDAAHIGIAVEKGVITLTGHVGSYAEKQSALAATRRVRGVRAIADEIQLRYPAEKKFSDDEIAKRVSNILDWDPVVPKGAIQITVRGCLVTLTGSVDWNYQRMAAEQDIRKLNGIVGVLNNVEIKPRLQADDVKQKIEQALKRHAAVESQAIRVTVLDSNRVILEGTVGNWQERLAVEDAAWSAAGVKSVDDRLSIT